MVEWPTLLTVKQLRGFLSLTRYYRRFIQGYSSIAASLTDLLAKNAFLWDEKTDKAFQYLKQAMTSAPMLTLSNFSIPFVVETDASKSRIGAVLMQLERPIAFFNKKMGPKMQATSTYIKELYAISEAAMRWRQYLLGHHFFTRTDHCSITKVFSQVIQTPAQQHFICKLMGYSFTIEYKSSLKNKATNALSRKFEELKAGEEVKFSYLRSEPTFAIFENIKME
eukprot:TRINITY_DN5971_c0_g1_i1.p1 TRINITY_DN5971_c0_g1~~TRINITY_DN5971_c0_g1_i1.p1  ORF type:complete len:224 (+),score=25.42 TRINITY_DN5971_c0_g1_i1:1403-2074(+)